MRAIYLLACGFLLGFLLARPAHGQEKLAYGSPVTRTLEAGQSHSYTFDAHAGEMIAGQAQLVGSEGGVQFLDGAGHPVDGGRINFFFLGGTTGRRVGFVAPASGAYQVRINAFGSKSGTYTIRLEQFSVAERMRGIVVTPKEISTSPRIRRLANDVAEGRVEAVSQFWREVARTGPLVEVLQGNDQDQLVTFLWRQTFETHNVLVGWPMAVFRGDDYYMSHLGDTDVWYKTIQIRRGSKFSYWLAPNYRAGDFLYTARLDPLNTRIFPDDPSSTVDVNSVLETPGAPEDRWHATAPVERGRIESSKFVSQSLKGERDMWIYTPPGFSPLQQTYPLLVPFDGFSYVNPGMMNAPSTLDNLVNERRIRPLVVCFLGSVVRAVDLGFEGAAAFGDAIVRELLPRPRSSHGVSTAPGDVAIGGSSAGGLAAALSALDHSDAFGNVLSQSGAFRFPAVGKSEPNAISQRYAEAPRLPIRFHIETGIYENLPSAGLPLHELAVDEGVTTANRHFRDVLRAKGYDVIYRESATAHEPLHWRATLADALIALFNPAR